MTKPRNTHAAPRIRHTQAFLPRLFLGAAIERQAVKESGHRALLERIELQRHAESILGERGWFLVSHFGKLTAGSDSGRYVSGLSAQHARVIVDSLSRGDLVSVHLMHRHRSGVYKYSQLRLRAGRLEMVFADRIEPA